MNNLIKVSKRLAYLLRHSDLPNRNGWVAVDVVSGRLHIALSELETVVVSDAKGRFEFSSDALFVRALYGHSVDVDLELVSSAPPTILYHGTAEKYMDCIMQKGLEPRKRNYVHLSETIDMAQQVGARHGSPVVLSVNAQSMAEEGFKFYKSQSGIWLVESVPYEYLKVCSYE